MKKIVVINGHPDKNSFCHTLAETYKKGADTKAADCQVVHLADLKFNKGLSFDYLVFPQTEPDILQMQKDILQADHLVFVYPTWWETYPSLLKGFMDRVFVPNFAFKYYKDSPAWDKLLKDKSARIITTMVAPKWSYWWSKSSPGHNSMKKAILEFCGVNKPLKVSTFAPLKSLPDWERKKWLAEVESLGRNLN